MKLIPLTQGKFAMVDDEDFEWLNQWKWRAGFDRHNWYAVRAKYSYNSVCTIRMHSLIMGIATRGIMPDHRDFNGLNNQRYNLRIATHSQNNMNKRPQKNKSSIYKGVHKCKERDGWWQAVIVINNKRAYGKRFRDEIEAALQYDIWAKELFGEFAWLNFPENKTVK